MQNVSLAGHHLYVFSPRDVLDEIWDLIESVSGGYITTLSFKIKKRLLESLCSFQVELQNI